MVLPLAGWALVTAIITITGGAGFAAYQLRASVNSVEEVFTNKDSALNNIAFQAIIGAVAVFALTRFIK